MSDLQSRRKRHIHNEEDFDDDEEDDVQLDGDNKFQRVFAFKCPKRKLFGDSSSTATNGGTNNTVDSQGTSSTQISCDLAKTATMNKISNDPDGFNSLNPGPSTSNKSSKKRTYDEMDWESSSPNDNIPSSNNVSLETNSQNNVPSLNNNLDMKMFGTAPANKKRNCISYTSFTDDDDETKEAAPAPAARRRWTINLIKCEQSLTEVDFLVT